MAQEWLADRMSDRQPKTTAIPELSHAFESVRQPGKGLVWHDRPIVGDRQHAVAGRGW